MFDSVLKQISELKIVQKTKDTLATDPTFQRSRAQLGELSQKTTARIDEAVGTLVTKLTSNLDEPVDDAVRSEIKKSMLPKLDHLPDGKEMMQGLVELNHFVTDVAPRSLDDLKNLRSTVAKKLVRDARSRMENRSR